MAVDVGSIIAHLLLDRSQFTRELAAAEAEARAFGDVTVPVDADLTRFDEKSSEVFAAKRVMAEAVTPTVGMNQAPFDAGAAQVEALKAALARPVEIPVEIDASKLNLFQRLVSGGESPGDVAKYLGFSRAELSSALGSLAMQAAEDAKAELSQAGEYAAEQMIAGWMAAAQRELGSGSPVATGFYRLLSGGADPYLSTGGAIPIGPSRTNWDYYVPPLALGPGQPEGPAVPPWIPPALNRPPEPLQLLAQNPESYTYQAYQKMYEAWAGTSGDTTWAEGPITIPSEGGGGGGFLSSLLGGVLGRLGSKDENGSLGVLGPIAAAGGIGGLLTSLLWGGGSGGVGLPFLGTLGAGMAGLGSLGSFAGLGPEHLLMTGIGLAGNAAGAGLGGALLGLGSLGVMGVGMGTDLAGVGQAAGDIKQYGTLQSNLQQASAVYGKGSTEYKLAEYQYQQWAQNLNAATINALATASKTAGQFHTLFDQATAQAETTGAQILTQAMQVGEKYLPTIGKFAAQNMGIIKTDLQPLFTWLQGPGLAIFTELEQKFQSELPTAMHAFDQGIELLFRTIGLIAPQTGGLIKTIDQLVTRFNGSGWGQWSGEVEKLIGDFRAWEALIKLVIADVYQLFHHDAGTASGIVASLTQMLEKLHQYETSVQGGAAIHTMFETHKQEVLALLQLLPPLLGAFGKIYLTVAPQMTQLMTVIVKLVDAMLQMPAAGPLLAWGLAVGFIMNKVGLLTPLLGTLNRALGAAFVGEDKTLIDGMVASLGNMATSLAALVFGEEAVTGATTAMKAAMVAASAAGILVLALGVYELIHHFGVLPGLMLAGAAAVVGLTVAMWALDAVPVVALVVAIGLAIAGLVAGIVYLVEHWRVAWDAIKTAVSAAVAGVEAAVRFLVVLWPEVEAAVSSGASAVVRFFEQMPARIVAALQNLPQVLGGMAGFAIGAMAAALVEGAKGVWSFWAQFVPTVVKDIGDWGGKLSALADKAIKAMVSGLTTAAKAVWDFFTNLPSTASKLLSSWGASLAKVASDAIGSMVSGITTAAKAVWAFFTSLPGNVVKLLGELGKDLEGTGSAAIGSMVSGITSAAKAVWSWFKALPGRIVSALGDVGSLLVHAGESIMAGFLSGLKNGFGSVSNFVGGIAGWISKHKGPIEVDAVLLVPHGEAIMAGLAQGLRNGLRASVLPALQTATSTLSSSMKLSGMTVSGASGFGVQHFVYQGGPVTVTLTGVTASDAPKIRQTIDQALEERDRAFMATWKQKAGSR